MSNDIGKLILRLTLGVLIIMHGIFKLRHGVGGISGLLGQHGLPAFLAYGLYLSEFICPILLIVGLYTRPAAVIVAISMLFAIFLTSPNALFTLNKEGGFAIELEYFYLFTAVAISFFGAGRFGLRSPYN